MRLLLLLMLVFGLTAAELVLTIPGFPGRAVISLPKNWSAEQRWPVILALHGQGGEPTVEPWASITQDRGWVVVGLPYSAQADLAAGGMRREPPVVAKMHTYLAAVIDRLVADYGADRHQVVLAGVSMGGWGVSSFGVDPNERKRFAGYLIAAAAPTQDADWSLAAGQPVLVLNGSEDPNAAVADRMLPLLDKGPCRVTVIRAQGEGHVPDFRRIQPSVLTWLDTVKSQAEATAPLPGIGWRQIRSASAPPEAEKTWGRWLLAQGVPATRAAMVLLDGGDAASAAMDHALAVDRAPGLAEAATRAETVRLLVPPGPGIPALVIRSPRSGTVAVLRQGRLGVTALARLRPLLGTAVPSAPPAARAPLLAEWATAQADYRRMRVTLTPAATAAIITLETRIHDLRARIAATMP